MQGWRYSPGLSRIKAAKRREAPVWTEQGHPRPEGPAGVSSERSSRLPWLHLQRSQRAPHP